jgi:ATP-dependent helicase HrpA
LAYSSETTELGNDTLPVFAYRKEIVDAVRDNPFTIVVAETGAGKSTQVPQFLLEEGWDKVYLTQPRRAAARNVFERIRSEIGDVRGEYKASDLVSYQTAGEREGSEEARIKVVTDGLHLVRELHDSGVTENEVLIIDEVHEWNANIEVLVAWVKKAIAEKPHLRVVVMSATMEADRLANYFADVCPRMPPIIEVPGRTYKVERSEKPDSTVAEEILKAAEKIHATQKTGNAEEQNGILLFASGKREINDDIDEAHRRLPADIAKVATILPLHAKLSPAEQQAALQGYPGVKIVVSTNLAQTSLTIPDIKYVIDPGTERRVELDQEGVQGLMLNNISQADCDQRAGRAGRVGDGFYILTRQDAKTPYVPYIARDKYPTPEILRTDIVRNTLRVAGVGLDLATLDLYHPVNISSVEKAQATLQTLGALDNDNRITSLGRRMDQFPVCASSGRMMVEADRYAERTRAYLSAIVAAKEVGGLQNFGYNVEKRWKDLTEETSSDLLSQLDMFIAIQDMTPSEMLDYDLDLQNVVRAREQYRKIAKLSGALREEALLPPTLEEREDLRHCIYAGMITSIYTHSGGGLYEHVGSPETPREISNRSLVQGSPQVLVGDPYRVIQSKNGERVVRHILERVTKAGFADLGRAASQHITREPGGHKLRAGKFMERLDLSLFGVKLGVSEEVVAEPSPALREAVITHTLENAGPQQTKLRSIKKELEGLAHMAKGVPQLTHDQIIELVRAAAPADVTDPSAIDNNLRAMIDAQGITLDKFVSPEQRKRIAANAPPELKIGDVTLEIVYRSARPLVRHFDPRDIEKLTDEIFLPDGRPVQFLHKGVPRNLMTLRKELRV